MKTYALQENGYLKAHFFLVSFLLPNILCDFTSSLLAHDDVRHIRQSILEGEPSTFVALLHASYLEGQDIPSFKKKIPFTMAVP